MLAAGLAVGVLAGCSDDAPPAAKAAAAPTPIGRLNTASMDLARIEFCSLLPRSAVREALDGRSGEGQRWRSGQEVAVTGDAARDASGTSGSASSDVVHENGCRWSKDGYSAAAWLFAEPVTSTQASTLTRRAKQQQGCTAKPGPGFGSPSQVQTCELDDSSRRVRFTGLFDDTWLTCEVQAPAGTTPAEVRTRAAAWCVQVANATNTSR